VYLLALFGAGIFQVLLGLMKLGAVANFFPSAVIKGMLSAIGIILISKQIPLALGYDQPDFWTDGFLGIFSETNIFKSIDDFYHHFSNSVLLITVVSLAILAL